MADFHPSVGEAKDEFHAALSLVERQTSHAQDALYKEQLNQARIHLESAAQGIDRAIRAKAALDRALSRAAKAVPYA